MKIPQSVIYVVGDVLGSCYYSHTKLDTLFGGNGFPGEPPIGNCVKKCQEWMRRANETADVNPIELLGLVLVDFMNQGRDGDSRWVDGVKQVNEILVKNGLLFDINGQIVVSPSVGSGQSGPETVEDVIEAKPTVAQPSEAQTACPVIVLVTVNDNETDAVLDAFLGKENVPVHVTVGGVTYNSLGIHGGCQIINTISEMGAGGIGSSQQRTRQAIEHWHPAAVIAVGVAFGVDETKQTIGLVLVSSQLQGYDLGRVSKNGTFTPRDDKASCSDPLRNRLKQVDTAKRRLPGWPKVKFGLMLSGQKLVDDLDYRESLKGTFPEAIGGEMEGTGVYVSASEAKTDWIVIKGICDWGHDKNSEKKEEWQRLAAKNAAEVLKASLDIGGLFSTDAMNSGKVVLCQITVPSNTIEPKVVELGAVASQMYLDLVDAVTEKFLLLYWSWFTSHAVRFLLSEEFVDGAHFIDVKVGRAIWPKEIPELEASIQNLAGRASKYVKRFLDKGKLRPSNKEDNPDFWVENKAWKEWYNPNYDKALEESQKWEKECLSLLFNVVVALNHYCDTVRKYLKPDYFALAGKFIVNDDMGVTSDMIPTVYIPENYLAT